MPTPLRIVQRVLPPPGPLRPLAAASVISDAGSALLITTLVLYFTREVGLSGAQVGLGLSLGGATGLFVGVPLGHLADVRGARGVAIALVLGQAVATLAYVFVTSFAAFIVAACVVVALSRGASAVEQGLVARVLPDGQRVRGRVYLGAIANIGFGVGSALATIGIAVDTETGYRAMIIVDAASYVIAALLIARVPRVGPVAAREAGERRFVVLRDRPYLAVIALSALFQLQVSVLDVGFPLWVTEHTAAPTWVIGVVFVLNCTLVALLSVRVARGSDATDRAARLGQRGAVTVAAACALLALTGGLAAAPAAVVLIVAMTLQAFAEMQHSAFHWGVAFGLAPEHRQGQYQGAAATGYASALAIGPLLIAVLVGLGGVGWLLFAALMLTAGSASVPLTRWAAAARAPGPAVG